MQLRGMSIYYHTAKDLVLRLCYYYCMRNIIPVEKARVDAIYVTLNYSTLPKKMICERETFKESCPIQMRIRSTVLQSVSFIIKDQTRIFVYFMYAAK